LAAANFSGGRGTASQAGRHGTSRASICPRDQFCRTTSIKADDGKRILGKIDPMVAMVAIDGVDIAVLRSTLAPSRHPPVAGAHHSISC
jgi:hypothetical protein